MGSSGEYPEDTSGYIGGGTRGMPWGDTLGYTLGYARGYPRVYPAETLSLSVSLSLSFDTYNNPTYIVPSVDQLP